MPTCDWEDCFEPGVKRVKKWELTARNNSASGWMNNHGGRGARAGTRGSHGNRDYWYCREHYYQFMGQERAKGRGCLFLVVLAIVGIVAFALLSTSKSSKRSSAVSSATSAVTGEVTKASEALESTVSAPTEARSVEKSEVASDTPPPEVAESIRDATLKALDSGSAERWHKSHWSGFASVSAIQESNGKECRNAYATEEHKDTKLTTPTVQWCREAGGEWTAT